MTDRFATDSDDKLCTDLTDYCGGTWKAIEEKLPYITGMGFDAIWISPVVDNGDKGYHGYWARDWTKLNSKFGTKDDLVSLVEAAHKAGVLVMADVVANHVAPVGTDYSSIAPFD